jgi:hypothetical protein
MAPPELVTVPLIGPVLVVHAMLVLALLLLLLLLFEPVDPLLLSELEPELAPLLDEELFPLLELEWEDVPSESALWIAELQPTALSDNEIAPAPAETVSATRTLATRSQPMRTPCSEGPNCDTSRRQMPLGQAMWGKPRIDHDNALVAPL